MKSLDSLSKIINSLGRKEQKDANISMAVRRSSKSCSRIMVVRNPYFLKSRFAETGFSKGIVQPCNKVGLEANMPPTLTLTQSAVLDSRTGLGHFGWKKCPGPFSLKTSASAYMYFPVPPYTRLIPKSKRRR